MRLDRGRLQEDPNSRVAPYESLLDLFTLISFILILGAFVYVERTAAGSKGLTSFTAEAAQRGSGVPTGYPKDVVLIVVSKEESKDKLVVIDGASGMSTNTYVSEDEIPRFLNSLSLPPVRKVNVAFYEAKEQVNPGIVVAIERWLAQNQFKDPKLYFVGKQ